MMMMDFSVSVVELFSGLLRNLSNASLYNAAVRTCASVCARANAFIIPIPFHSIVCVRCVSLCRNMLAIHSLLLLLTLLTYKYVSFWRWSLWQTTAIIVRLMSSFVWQLLLLLLPFYVYSMCFFFVFFFR